MSDSVIVQDVEVAPEPPPKGPVLWLRENLFSSRASGVMTIVSVALVLFAVRGLLGFAFDPLRRWDAVTFNMKLLMVFAYPREDLWRVWLTVGIIAGLLAASLAVWRVGGRTEPRRLGATLMSIGGAIVLCGLLGPFSMSARLTWLLVGAILLIAGYVIRVSLGERAKAEIVPIMAVVGVLIALGVALIWVIEVPVPAKVVDGVVITDGAEAAGVRGEQIKVLRPIASTTTVPWTIIAAVSIVVYGIFHVLGRGGRERAMKQTLTTLWVMSFPVLVLVLLRNPVWNWDSATSVYLPGLIAFGLIGTLVLWYVARPGAGEAARALGALVLILAFVSFLIPMPYVYRLLLLALALFALAGPSFGGEGWRGLAAAWWLTVLVIAGFVWVTSTESGIEVSGSFFIGGLALTIIIAFTAIVLSFPLGVVLALGRTSTMPIFRLLCTAYIELVRGVPLITWLLIAFLMLPVALPQGIELGGVVRVIGAMTFFSAAYLAENVRGGLQSISAGQKEASRALGMSTIQMTVFITLPQALRAVIPALVGQVIALFKDTSLVTIVGLADFLHISRAIIPSQSTPFSFLGSIKETLLFAALVYWVFTFTFSRISLRLEKKLGVGER